MDKAETGMHLFCLHHGLWGHPRDLEYLAQALSPQSGQLPLLVLNCKSNTLTRTLEGIDCCGERWASDIREHIKVIESDETKKVVVSKISFVGYSFGGLINRYTIGKLLEDGFFKTVEPVNFITVATPNLGSWRQTTSIYNRFFNSLVSAIGSRAGVQLMLKDGNCPLLISMTQPGLPFYEALKLFRKRTVYANIFYDRPVHYTTASISDQNPYQNAAPVAKDPKYPSIVVPVPGGRSAPLLRFQDKIVLAALLVLAPVLLPFYLTFVGVGCVIASYQYHYTHSKLQAPVWLLKKLQLAGLLDANNHPQVLPVAKQADKPITEPLLQASPTLGAELQQLAQRGKHTKQLVAVMCSALNELGWEKVDCYTHPLPSAHASIITRDIKKHPHNTDVVRHLVNHVLL